MQNHVNNLFMWRRAKVCTLIKTKNEPFKPTTLFQLGTMVKKNTNSILQINKKSTEVLIRKHCFPLLVPD